MQAGISLDEVREHFSRDWEIVNAEQTSAAPIQVGRTRADQSFELWRFRLRRLSGEGSGAPMSSDVAARTATERI